MSKGNKNGFLESAQAMLRQPDHQLRLDRSHHLRVPSQWQFGPRLNHDWHLIYVHRGGRAWYDLPGGRVPLATNRIIFVPDGCSLSAHQGRPDAPLITPLRFAQWDAQQRIIPWASLAGQADNWMMWDDSRQLGTVFQSLHQWNHRKAVAPCIREQSIDTALRYVFAQLLDMCAQEDSPWTRLLDQLQTVRKPWSNQELAEALDVSDKYVVKLFRERLGETPHHYQLRLRCQYARQLLEETPMTIGEIANHLQYADMYAFSKQFKQFIGVSPRGYRELNRQRLETRAS